tara:strand:- start:427 stop:3384 length:2958 start_codon:yes stop_codon:yes gene_type:complete
MINLKPISKEIQQRMYQKMKALRDHGVNSAAPNSLNDTSALTFDDMATRSTYIAMVSNQENPITINGSQQTYGTTDSDGFGVAGSERLAAGYDEIYGPRTIPDPSTFDNPFDFFSESKALASENEGARPISGIKSIDVTFKGGLKSLREATINWICWDFKELDKLTPHFLATGKTVSVEWGWVYANKSTVGIPRPGMDAKTAFSDFSEFIINGQGDFDIMVGKIKDFEYSTRADGGFDCRTVLISTGVSMLENPQPNASAVDKTKNFNFNPRENLLALQKKISKATKFFGDKGNDEGVPSDIVTLDTSVTLKLFIDKIDRYISKQLAEVWEKGTKVGSKSQGSKIESKIISKPNKFLAYGRFAAQIWAQGGAVTDAWVQWGWFEDNVLNKFLGLTNENGDTVTKFQSVEKLTKSGNLFTGPPKLESVRIRNHVDLETTDINNHILPGQFYVAPKVKDKDAILLEGDSEYLQKLAKIVNENFNPFASNAILRETIVTQDYADPMAYQAGGPIMSPDMIDAVDIGSGGQERLTVTEDSNAEQQANPKPGRFGFLRNMLVNTKVIKDAFGSEGAFTAESMNITEALETMFYLLNQDLNFWSLQVSTDAEDTSRVKIVDETITAIDFSTTGLKTLGIKKSLETTLNPKSNIIIGEEGIFFFPTWRPDSFVKSQNVSLKISNAQQMTAMYGSNMNVAKELQNPASSQSDKGAALAGGFHVGDVDKSTKNIDIKFRNEITNGGPQDTVNAFIMKNLSGLEEAYEARLENLSEQIATAAKSEVDLKLKFDPATPPPLPRDLTDGQKKQILKYETNLTAGETFKSFFGYEKGEIKGLLNNKFDEKGRMKGEYLGMVSALTTNHGTGNQSDTPQIIPFDLELDIDGTGGIYPGNSFHSSYVPAIYQKFAVFQAFDISHKVDSSGWTTTIGGKMRSTASLVYSNTPRDQIVQKSLDNLLLRVREDEIKRVKKQSKQIEKRFGGKSDATVKRYGVG